MCLRPVKIHNRSLTVGCSDWSQYELQVPCGECAECKQLKRDQWYLRAYWQARYTFDQKGWVLFDTLTYDDSHLPRLSDYIPALKNRVMDFPCFSHEHIRRFWVDLRQYLDRAGYRTDFGYFLCSEYGTSERGTHRPHYHILIYNTDPRLSPEVLSEFISRAWKHGRTDGVPYRTAAYVIGRNVFGPKFDTDMPHMQAVCGYVMKYITKDSDFESRIQYRLNAVMDAMCRDKYHGVDDADWHRFPEFKERYRTVKRLVSQFHKQSQHFGEYALTQSDLDEIFDRGLMSVPDPDTVVKYIPIPMYYSRKLFCTQVKLDDGRRVWIPNELGKRYRYKRTYRSAALMVRRYNEWLDNIGTAYLPTDEFRSPDGALFRLSEQECREASEMLRKRFYELMRGRSLLDLATYQMFYRGRIIPREDFQNPVKLCPRDLISSQLSSDPRHTLNVYKLRTYVDPLTGDEYPLMSTVPDEEFLSRASDKLRGRSMEADIITVDVFRKHCVVNDSTFPEYEGFDAVIDLYEENLRIRSRRKQQAFDIRERVTKVRNFLKNS